MNFATLKGLTIPEGVVTQITDATGNVLWSAAPSGATVTITVAAGYEKDCLLIDGVYYGMQSTEITVPIGTEITISATVVFLNGATVSTSSNKYTYTVNGDVAISCKGQKPNAYYTVYQVFITEV